MADTKLAFINACPDGCPPEDAIDANGDFFRLAHSNPPESADFQTCAELGFRPNDDQCLRCGLSIFSSMKGATSLYRYLMKRHKGAIRLGRFIARLELVPTDGKVKQTRRPPHHTWWMYEDTDREATFRETVKELPHAQEN